MEEGTATDEYNWHGLRGDSWVAPRLAVTCALPVRPDQRNRMRADEFLDAEDVLEAKVALLAQMLRTAAGGAVVYSGAGLSRASGIADYGAGSVSLEMLRGLTFFFQRAGRPTRWAPAPERRGLPRLWTRGRRRRIV